jgi:hypothetical protein
VSLVPSLGRGPAGKRDDQRQDSQRASPYSQGGLFGADQQGKRDNAWPQQHVACGKGTVGRGHHHWVAIEGRKLCGKEEVEGDSKYYADEEEERA